MRTNTLLAAVAAGVLSLGLFASSAGAAQAAPQGRSLTGTATCDQGQASLTTSVDAAGTERGTVTLTGLGSKRWRGGLQLNPGSPVAKHAENKRHIAKHGRLSISARLAHSRSLDATASFISPALSMCEIDLMSGAGHYVVGGVTDGMIVTIGAHPSLQVLTMGDAHHRYLVTATVRTKTGVQTRSLVRVAGTMGMLPVTIGDLKGLAGFTEIKATIKDLTVDLPAESYSIAR